VSLPMLLPPLTCVRLRAHRRMKGMWPLDLSSRRRSAACPSCQHRSRAVHRAYRRTVADVPLAGAQLFLPLQGRRFFCQHATCPRRMFAERFPTLVPVRGRHSLGVCSALRHVGIAVGGRAEARLTRALGVPGSFRTMVRLVHGAPFPPLTVPRVIGLDEWAWHRGRPLVAPFTPYLRRRWNAGCRNAQQLWRELVAQGYQPGRRTVERYVGQLRRETGTRFKFRQATPAPLDAEDHDESRPSPLTALRAARLFLAKPEDRRSTDRALLAHLLRLDPVMPRTSHQVQTFCCMVRQRHSDDFDA
jgi:transposase